MTVSSQLDNRSVAPAVEAAAIDLHADRHEFYFRLPYWLEVILKPLLQDERDLPILYLFYDVLVTVLPAVLALFACPAKASLLGPVYLGGSYVLYLERYLLALHYSQHRRLFKAGTHLKCTVSVCFQHACHHQQADAWFPCMVSKLHVCFCCRTELAELDCSSVVGTVIWCAMRPVQIPSLHDAPCGKATDAVIPWSNITTGNISLCMRTICLQMHCHAWPR